METLARIFLNSERQARIWLTAAGGYVSLLLLRLLLGYEFMESGLEKLGGSNWFADVNFPFPFSLLSAQANWFLATWFEIVGAALLIAGLGTRYASISLIVVTLVATYAVHLPETQQLVDGEKRWVAKGIGSVAEFFDGYRISQRCAEGYCTGNYKLPVIYLFMLTPLVLSGAGRLSVDEWLRRRLEARSSA